MKMMQLAPEVKTLLNSCQIWQHRALVAITGEDLHNQVMVLHHLIAKDKEERPPVLWCHKKSSDLPSQSRKLVKKLEKKLKSGMANVSMENAFELFLISTPIKYCSLSETTRILGNTFGMAVIQDFEAVTPNSLCHIVETVTGGGIVVFLFHGVSSLREIFGLQMEVHSKLCTLSHPTVSPLFNERFIISLGWCQSALVINDQLGISRQLSKMNNLVYLDGAASAEIAGEDTELETLKSSVADADKPLPQLASLCCTTDQVKAVLKMIDVLTDKGGKATVSCVAARGRGKSAALGLSVVAAVHFGYSNVYVTTPNPENLKTFFSFLFKGFDALGYTEENDYEVVQSTNPEFYEAIVRVNIFHSHKQVIQYILPSDFKRMNQAELVVIDEAAAIPLPYVKAMIGPHNVFMASTCNGYEGTGRSLSLKLLQLLRKQSVPVGAVAVSSKVESVFSSCRPLHELTLESSIRYRQGDPVESWLHELLCLDATSTMPSLSSCPPPDVCELYYVNRDVLFSGHKSSEGFLNQIVALLVASHYRNSPDDLQILSDAPAHHLFVLLSPVVSSHSQQSFSVLTVIQIAFEGAISKRDAKASLSRGDRPSGDLTPWSLASQYLDYKFPQKKGVRIVRIATHSEYQSMGYGFRAIQCLKDYFRARFIPVDEPMDADEPLPSDSSSGLIGPRKTRIPLLSKLSERHPEEVDYLSVSFGLTHQLFKFWNKCGFLTFYVSQVANRVTGEHNCIMVHTLGEEDAAAPRWERRLSEEFVHRFPSLLGGSLRHLSSCLVAELLSSHSRNLPQQEISWSNLEKLITSHSVHRLKIYCKNLADYKLVSDLFPHLASLYFSQQLPRVELSHLQAPMLVCVGFQGNLIEDLLTELKLPITSLLGQFSRAMRKFLTVLSDIHETAVASKLPCTQKEAPSFQPVTLTLLSEIREGYKEFKGKFDSKEEDGSASLKKFRKYAIKGDEEQWDKALKSSNEASVISIKSTEEPRKAVSLLGQEMKMERNAKKGHRKKMKT